MPNKILKDLEIYKLTMLKIMQYPINKQLFFYIIANV
jgi:hypothetical protein